MYNWPNGFKQGHKAVRWALLAALIIALVPFHLPGVARADDTTVSLCTDAGLRTAVDDVQTSGGGTIVFDCTGTIVFSEQIVITSDVTIIGNGGVIFDGGGSTRLFSVEEGAALRLVCLTLQNGRATDGGAISSRDADLSIVDSTVVGNSATFRGGAIYTNGDSFSAVATTFAGNSVGDGTEDRGYGGAIYANTESVTISASTFTGNTADEEGGAIWAAGTLTITASIFSGNVAGGGGAIENLGTLSVIASTFNQNTAGSGGAISNAGAVMIDSSSFNRNAATIGSGGAITHSTIFDFQVMNSTFVGNTAGDRGGAIWSSGRMTLAHSTLTGNHASTSGGINAREWPYYVVSSIVAENTATAGQNCGGGWVVSQGSNLSDDSSCGFTATGDIQNSTDINLNALASNGGPTQTVLPMANSAAIDNAECRAEVDQRGAERPQSACDIGTVEVGGTVPVQIFAFESLSPPLDEGQNVDFIGVAYGPDNSDLSYGLDCDNDGVYETAVAGSGTTVNASCVLPDDGLLTIGLQACDGSDANNCDTATTEVTTFNVPPAIDLIDEDGPVDEGSPVSITVDATDPGWADVLTYSFDCDNDASYETAGAGNVGQCTYADEGSFTVGVKVEDDDGGVATDSIDVEAVNVPPVVDVPITSPAPSNEGEVVTASATFSDAGFLDTHTCSVDYGDGSGPQAGVVDGYTCTGPAHQYADDYPSGTSSDDYAVDIIVVDNDGDEGSRSVIHTVRNLLPIITSVQSNGPIEQGAPATVTVLAHDPAGPYDPLTYAFDCDNNGVYETAGAGNQGTCSLDPAAAVTTIGVEVDDGDSGIATDTVDVAQTLLMCGNGWTGAMSMPGPGGVCNGTTLPLVSPSAVPTTLCINMMNGGALSWSPSGQCSQGQYPHVVPTSGPLHFCRDLWTGQIKGKFGPGQCGVREVAGVIPG